jgi:HAD superfamily hydrolase (TIGR01490 family)
MSYYVFSDVDETLIRFKSMLSFMSVFLFECHYDESYKYSEKRIELNTIVELLQDPNISREALNRRFYDIFQGISQNTLQKAAFDWIHSHIKNNTFFIDSTLEAFKEHQKNGAKIVLVSGSFRELLEPIQLFVKADHLICSELELKDAVYTGQLLKQVIGEGKWTGILNYIGGKNIELSSCYAYGDHHSDICFMEKVGHPVLVGGSPEMKQIARLRNWQWLPV